jgi:PAS domain S-box-containing protein
VESTVRAALESAPQGIIVVNGEGCMEIVNVAAEQMFGYNRQELLGKPVELLIAPPLREAHAARRADCFAGAQSQPMAPGMDLKGLRKDGSEFPIEISLSCFETERGPLAAAFIADTTARKKLEDELQALATNLLSLQEEERKRLSRELHDDLSQQVAVLSFELTQIEQHIAVSPALVTHDLQSLRGRLNKFSRDIHRIAYHLHPVVLDQLGLAAALASQCAAFTETEGIEVEFASKNVPGRNPEDISLCLYRVVQECLHNVAKHAKASRATVTLEASGGGVRVSIQDFGVGFDPSLVKETYGLGFISMRERVSLVRGALNVTSLPGSGTGVEAWVPLPGGGL